MSTIRHSIYTCLLLQWSANLNSPCACVILRREIRKGDIRRHKNKEQQSYNDNVLCIVSLAYHLDPVVCLLLHNHPYCTWHIMLNCFYAWWFNYPGTLSEHQFGPLKLECNCLGGCNVRVWLELALAHSFNVEVLDQACWVYMIIKVWCGWGRTLYGTCRSEHAHFM